MVANIRRLAHVLVAGFVLAGLSLMYWQLIRAPQLVAREDNPRRVQAELQVRRGRLLDRTGAMLAYSEAVGRDGTVRRAYLHQEAAHALGYYSSRYGTSGCEAVFDATLRGRMTPLEQLLHRPQFGEDVTLSVDLDALRAADRGLGEHRGAVVVLDITTGSLMALVSHPSFDAGRLDAAWDELVADPAAPLLNRALQGVYPVGDLSRWVALAGLLSAGITSPPDPYSAPLEDFLRPLSPMGYLATARQLGFDLPPPIDLPSSAGRLPDLDGKGTPRDLAVTPMHMARFVAAVAGDGGAPLPRLGQASDQAATVRIFSSSVSASLRAVMPQHGDLAGWAGVAQPLETGSEPLSWFAGYAPVEEPHLAVVVVMEATGDGAEATVPVAQRTVAALQ
jgi:cell division protein FtsI/penicillin-binding protein 2